MLMGVRLALVETECYYPVETLIDQVVPDETFSAAHLSDVDLLVPSSFIVGAPLVVQLSGIVLCVVNLCVLL